MNSQCCEKECKVCCESKIEMPAYLKCEKAKRVYLKEICKEEAKHYCHIRCTLKGLGMGMPVWVPQMCDKKCLEEKCCTGLKGKEEVCDPMKCVNEPDCLTKSLLECKLVPQFIKDCPVLLCMFRKQVIKHHAKQSIHFYRMSRGCCMSEQCCDKNPRHCEKK
eukprot:gnl/Chilomastix_caulleri/1464.p1 GENE.gnl/Chilomastix_caulleri/1464~~gnl/Chilomastix_caulleri/1464.p1  ORF type:complete len:163 (+),score=40.01 gnl/Chilomastix_caulleri/1464:71-559(+)